MANPKPPIVSPLPAGIAARYGSPNPPDDVVWKRRDVQSTQQATQPGPPAIAFPPAFFPPADAEHFILSDETDSNAAGVMDFTAATASFQISPGYIGVLVEVSFFATNADSTLVGSVFRLRLDAAAPAGWSVIRVPQTGGTAIWSTDKAYLRMAANQTIGFQFVNNTGSPHHVGFSAHGWQWPVGEGQ